MKDKNYVSFAKKYFSISFLAFNSRCNLQPFDQNYSEILFERLVSKFWTFHFQEVVKEVLLSDS